MNAGIIGNEMADEQASIAINNNENFLISQMSYDDSKKCINYYTKNKRQRIWNVQNTKVNEICTRDIYCWSNPKLNRKEVTVLNRLRINYVNHQTRLNS
ncbi:unnamed protein product [Macrosiphum euphorbiae]|uniref:Uncharacterized protein n=1 Tax=Macrosiphum euphorbiae TaxID=13131 RepID=A0AAV0XY38_9HEMI|nr:unnamed protein product [Macrosiphum euphorbiae]